MKKKKINKVKEKKKKKKTAGLAWPPREVEVMRSLHHPNIVALLDIVVMGDSWYVMTELVSGGEVSIQKNFN